MLDPNIFFVFGMKREDANGLDGIMVLAETKIGCEIIYEGYVDDENRCDIMQKLAIKILDNRYSGILKG